MRRVGGQAAAFTLHCMSAAKRHLSDMTPFKVIGAGQVLTLRAPIGTVLTDFPLTIGAAHTTGIGTHRVATAFTAVKALRAVP